MLKQITNTEEKISYIGYGYIINIEKGYLRPVVSVENSAEVEFNAKIKYFPDRRCFHAYFPDFIPFKEGTFETWNDMILRTEAFIKEANKLAQEVDFLKLFAN